jgi:hypothetical protein
MHEASMWKQNVLRNAIKFGNRLRTERSKRVPSPKRKLIVETLEVRAVLSSTPIVIDNSDPGFSKTGTWASASGGYAGNVDVSSAPNNGSEVGSWTFIVAPGTYRVANTWHTSNWALGSNVPFKVFDGTSLIATVPVNQQIAPNDFVFNSVWWENLGIFNVNSILRVEISDNANGLVVADAMRIERVDAVTSTSIIDDSGSGFSKSAGSWGVAPAAGSYANSVTWAGNPGDWAETAEWNFYVMPGTYRISMSWHGGAEIYASNTRVSVSTSSTLPPVSNFYVNQKNSPNDLFTDSVWWENLGFVSVTSSNLKIIMFDGGNGYFMADAMRIERIEQTTSTTIVDDNSAGFSKSAGSWGVAPAAGSYANSVTWPGNPGDGVESAEWNFFVTPGTYRLAMSWHGGADYYASNTPISVYSDSTLVGSAISNQRVSPSDFFTDTVWWDSLGEFVVTGSLLRIKMFDSGDGYFMADAMRIERITNSTDVPIVNPSFESQALSLEGQTATTITGWTPGSTVSPASATALNPSTIHTIGGNASHGSNVAWVYQNFITQTLTHTFLAEKEYRLSADLAFPIGTATSMWKVELLSGTTVLAFADERTQLIRNGSFSTVELSYVSTSVVPSQPLAIRLTSATGTTYFDNVRLTYTNARFAVPIGNDDVSYFTLPGADLVVGPGSSLLSNDYSPETVPLSAVVVSQPANGGLTSFSTNGTFTYRPFAGFTGIDTFTYKAVDGVLESAPTTVRIAVGTRVLPRQNKDPIVFNPVPWSEGFGQGYSNVPISTSADTDGALAKTGGLLLSEDVLPGVSLVYRSDSLARPIIEVETQLAPGVSVPPSVNAQLTFNGTVAQTFAFPTSSAQATLQTRRQV